MKGVEANYEIALLIVRLIEGKITEYEKSKLDLWISESKENKQLFEKWTNPAFLEKQMNSWDETQMEERWKNLRAEISEAQGFSEFRGRRNIRRVFRYAAIFIGILLFSYAVLNIGKREERRSIAEQPANQIVPLGNVAQLVLGNGQIVNLGNNPGETITEKDGTTVHNRNEMLEYVAPANKEIVHEVVYNTLMVPLGGEYKITLSDGTKVWLNAASSLKYPTHFEGKERKVILTGEGYFEVTHDKEKPFKVQTGSSTIRVLGTKFNVMSYADEAKEKIVLAEGSVLVEQEMNGIKNEVMLKPGYGAIIEKRDGNIYTGKVNLDAELGWKDDLFVFDNETLSSIMKRMARWYNVSVKYEDNVDTSLHFTGRIRRFGDIRDVFHLISMTNRVKFEVNNREVNVISVPTN